MKKLSNFNLKKDLRKLKYYKVQLYFFNYIFSLNYIPKFNYIL